MVGGMRQRAEGDAGDHSSFILLAMKPPCTHSLLVHSMVLDAPGHDRICALQLCQSDPSIQIGRPDIEARIVEGKRPIELQEVSFAGDLCFLIGREVLGPAVASYMEENTVQARLICTHHAPRDGSLGASVKPRKLARHRNVSAHTPTRP